MKTTQQTKIRVQTVTLVTLTILAVGATVAGLFLMNDQMLTPPQNQQPIQQPSTIAPSLSPQYTGSGVDDCSNPSDKLYITFTKCNFRSGKAKDACETGFHHCSIEEIRIAGSKGCLPSMDRYLVGQQGTLGSGDAYNSGGALNGDCYSNYSLIFGGSNDMPSMWDIKQSVFISDPNSRPLTGTIACCKKGQ